MRLFVTLTALVLAVSAPVVNAAPVLEWNLAEMYPTEKEFLDARAELQGRIAEMEECRGRLGESAAVLLGCLDLGAELDREYSKLFCYAFLNLDKDLRNAKAQQTRAETLQVGVQMNAAVAFAQPEILQLGKDKVEAFLAEEKRLARYEQFLRNIVRQAEHTLPSEQEEMLSKTGSFSGRFRDIYLQLSVSDLPYPTVELPGVGQTLVDQAAYSRYRSSNDRAVRIAVFDAFWPTFAAYQNTFGALLDSEVQKNWFYAEQRHYDSALAASLDEPNIPESVYTSLIREVRANLPLLHRALQIRQRMLGLDTQHYHDIYASIVPEVEMTYPWGDVGQILTEALAPLGESYVSTVAGGLDSWVDVYPADGKQNGAYSAGRWYDGHPWVLMNYDDSYASLSTIAHEMGHAMHSWLSNKNQPYPTSGYPTFVAEVASTFNEVLLQEHLLATEDDPQKQLFLLGSFLERFRQTVFRQTMFAEFQLEIHKRAEQGQTLTGESLSELYLQLLREYHGHEQGVMAIEDAYQVEWAYIPHFFRGFYVYTYATGMITATALAEQVMADEPGAVERYLQLLSSGSSAYAIDMLRAAGADLTTSEPFDIAFAGLKRSLDRIEALLEQ